MNFALTTLVASGFAWLYVVHRRIHLRLWATGWILNAIGVGLGAIELELGASAVTALGVPFVTLGALQVLRGVYSFVGRPIPRSWYAAATVALAAGMAAAVAGLPLQAVAALPALCSVMCLCAVGVVLLRDRPRYRGAWVAGSGHIAMAINAATFPIAASTPELLPAGFAVAMVLATISAGGLFILHYDRAQRQLAHSESCYRSLFDNALVGVFQARNDGTLIRANAALVDMLGLAPREDLSSAHSLVDYLVDASAWSSLTDANGPGRIAGQEIRWRRVDGREIVGVVHARHTTDSSGVPRCDGIVQDVTESRALRQQLADARRFEAVGSLAGGVAHDFNNLLTVIMMQTEILALDVSDRASVVESSEAIASAAKQARRLTRQLLAFGRETMLDPTAIDLTLVLDELVAVFERVVPANITLAVQRPRSACVVVDRGSIEQLVTNLLTNACAAMPHGGQLSLDLTVTEPPPGVLPGPWAHVELTVSDDGEGMDQESRSRMFDPFFTTRRLGRGTGLGLATVAGIVGQLRGELDVQSAVDQGTTIRVRLRLRTAADVTSRTPDDPRRADHESLRVLVVEDQAEVRRAALSALRRDGHVVAAAENGAEALRQLSQPTEGNGVDLVISDVVMPVMGGLQLVEHLRGLGNRVPVLLMTGYAAPLGREMAMPVQTRLLQKPFTHDQLRDAVATIVAESREARRGQARVRGSAMGHP